MSLRWNAGYMNPYDLHKLLINDYILKKPGDTRLLQRDTSGDKTDHDVIKEHHKFLWDEGSAKTWEEQLAKKYYDKLFKEYCIGDLSRYKENKIALRWRIEQEVISGKGQFTCGNKKCSETENLRTWEVNFAYLEQNEKKNALVKIRLCPDCSKKLNYHTRKREIKRLSQKSSKVKHKKKKHEEGGSSLDTSHSSKSGSDSFQEAETELDTRPGENEIEDLTKDTSSPWTSQQVVESKTRDDEMEEYLQELLL